MPAMVEDTLPGVRQSDMGAYRGCRQKWEWSSSLRRNLRPLGVVATPLWFGTVMHAVMEDYFGYRRFADPRQMLRAVVNAFPVEERPDTWDELLTLGDSILLYFLKTWLPRRDEYKTLVIGGVPQVEVKWSIPVPGLERPFTGTFDRIVTDTQGGIWVMDYKFMRAIETAKLENDFQVTHYIWAAQQLFANVQGLVYLQFAKTLAGGPARLKDGKDGTPKFSKDKSANVTYGAYERALIDAFGFVPDEYIEHLNFLTTLEDADGDPLIRRTVVTRGPHFIQTHAWNIRAQAQEMLYPQLAIYPSPSAACQGCAFKNVCLAKQEEADFEYLLAEQFTAREDQTLWQQNIKFPDAA